MPSGGFQLNLSGLLLVLHELPKSTLQLKEDLSGEWDIRQ